MLKDLQQLELEETKNLKKVAKKSNKQSKKINGIKIKDIEKKVSSKQKKKKNKIKKTKKKVSSFKLVPRINRTFSASVSIYQKTIQLAEKNNLYIYDIINTALDQYIKNDKKKRR